jgi:UDP-N-acetyl-D-mannosaminuronic acid dehydrogenase
MTDKKIKYSHISVIGLGYIGLPTAAIFANRGVQVTGVDISKHVVETINAGKTHILEPDLDILVRAAVGSKRLKAVLTPEPAQAFLLAVPTPFKSIENSDHLPDLSMVKSSCVAIAPVLERGNLVILESTSPVGTTEKVERWLSERRPDLTFPFQDGDCSDIHVAHCPERVLPGKVLRELVENDRIIGGLSQKSTKESIQLYKIVVKGECIPTDARTAEMAKLTENSFRDVNIAFANELSIICEKLGINVWELISLANRHPRVNILRPGPGVGGHCIAVDPWFIIDSAPEESKIIKQARLINLDKTEFVIKKIKRLSSKLKNPVIACLGLAFKPDIDDLRESPAIEIVQKLADSKENFSILAVEPHIKKVPTKLTKYQNIKFSLLNEAIEKANVVIVLVAHKQFKNIDRILLDEKIIIDSCGIWH